MKRIGEIAVSILIAFVVFHVVFAAIVSAACFGLALLQGPVNRCFTVRTEEDRLFMAERIARLKAMPVTSEDQTPNP